MICLSCKTAADMPVIIGARPLLPGESWFGETQRAELHANCVGAGSCTCQHRVSTPKLTEEKRRA